MNGLILEDSGNRFNEELKLIFDKTESLAYCFIISCYNLNHNFNLNIISDIRFYYLRWVETHEQIYLRKLEVLLDVLGVNKVISLIKQYHQNLGNVNNSLEEDQFF